MELFIVSNNQHKIEEFKQLLEPLGYCIKSLKDISFPIEIEETGKTFEENAILKAKTCFELLNIPCIADDSGFEVIALNNEPGVLSARYLGEKTSYDYKNEIILQRLKDVSDRSCRYVCVIAYVDGETVKTFQGVVNGLVSEQAKGTNGFGYDPIFYYPPFSKTLAEVKPEEKNSVSHRYQAVVGLVNFLEKK